MAKVRDLIVVESPAKTRTLSSFLKGNYDIRASMGHVRDLPKSKLGVDVERGFEPTYTTIPERRQVIADLKKAARDARIVYLASDPDREGEAIAWHLAEVLGGANVQRIEFHELTQRAVNEALQNPHPINQHRVDAQQTRRVLDRLVGYKLSPLLWKKVQKNLSAGRVQSVAVRLVVEREREIQGFVSTEYWSLHAGLTPHGKDAQFQARLHTIDGKKAEIGDRQQMEELLGRLGHRMGEEPTDGASRWRAEREASGPEGPWRVGEVRTREQQRNPAPPFITSTLQQEAARKLGFNARRTMQCAQQLYEGLELGGEGHVGLITYMRTDSVAVSRDAQAECKQFIEREYGPDYVPPQPRSYKARKGAQEAHEAIRPTSVYRTPAAMRPFLNSDQYRLYDLIWRRFVASQMAAARYDATTADVHPAASPGSELLFRASGRVVKFDGFMRLYTEGRDDRARQEQEEEDEEERRLPALKPGQLLDLLHLTAQQHFTEPPPRYTEATLVRALEERGIGRPSTYAQIMSTIVERAYVELREKRFHPTELGCIVNDQLVRHFPDVVSAEFTASVEQQLDDIAQGERGWQTVLQDFYGPFSESLVRAESEMERIRPTAVPTEVPCPDCGQNMVIRSSRFGKFLGCSGFPECRRIVQMGADGQPQAGGNGAAADGAAETKTCPDCGRPMQQRAGRFGQFWGCTGYPECKKIIDPKRESQAPPDPDFSMPCPVPGCPGTVRARRSFRGTVFYGCDQYGAEPKCEYVSWSRPETDRPCDTCGFPMAERMFRGNSQGYRCTNSRCPTVPPPKPGGRGRKSATSKSATARASGRTPAKAGAGGRRSRSA